jgi:hypothetical protein
MHKRDQNQKILITNSLTRYNAQLEEEAAAAGILEWQAAFQRNNLADFTPPMSSAGMQCLMIGEDVDVPNPNQRNHFQTKLPWEDEAEADVTSLQVVNNNHDVEEKDGNSADIIPIQTKLIPSSTAQSSSHDSPLMVNKGTTAAVYDCIFDQGLLGSVLDQPDQVQQLLREAAIALREHGIYVLTTKSLTASQQELLTNLTQDCGLEWIYALDGISDETQQVSVARRFNNGDMPKVGRLSRYQP